MKTVLYDLESSTKRREFARGPVRSVPGMLAGHYVEGVGTIQPDHDAVRECLPYYWRKAFDRAGRFWFPHDGAIGRADSYASLTLHDSRGKRQLARVTATPRLYDATQAEA